MVNPPQRWFRTTNASPPGPSHLHGRQIATQRHVLRELFLRNSLLDLELSVLHATDVAIHDASVIFLAEELVALRVGERVLHLHAFEGLDHAFHILAGLVAGGLTRLLDGKDVLPRLPAVALVHHAPAADFARVDIINADELVEFLVELVILGGQRAWEILEEVDAFRRALDVTRVD